MKAVPKPGVLQEHLLKNSISPEQFAKNAGINLVALYSLLGGRTCPVAKTRRRLLAATGLAFDDLFDIRRKGQ